MIASLTSHPRIRRGRGPWLEFIKSKHASLLVLALSAALSLVVYLGLLVRPLPLFHTYLHGRMDGLYINLNEPYNQVRLIIAFLLLGGFYISGWWAARRVGPHGRSKLAWTIVLGGACAFALSLLCLYPFDAADIFDNILHGRILGVYGGNPYVQVGRDYQQDPFLPYMAWKKAPSAYGPLWEIIAGGAARLAGDDIPLNILVFKLLPGAFWLGSLVVAALLSRRTAPDQTLPNVYLLAWNPIVLYSTFGNGHNDTVMIFWVLLAAWALLEKRYTSAILALLAGALVKYIPLLLLPAALGIALKRISGSRLRFLILTGLAGLLLVLLAYLPFWEGVETLSIERRSELFTSSLPAVVYHLMIPRLGQDRAAHWVSLGATVVTGLFALWRGWIASRGTGRGTGRDPEGRGFLQASFDILVFYLLTTCLWFQQWYTVWIIGVAAALPYSGRQRLAVFFSLAALGKQLIVAPYLFDPKPVYEQPKLEVLFTLGVLGLPWLYALTIWLQSKSLNRKTTKVQ